MTPVSPRSAAAVWNDADRAADNSSCHDLGGWGLPPSETAVVTAGGEIDFRTAPALSRRLHQAIDHCAAVVLDLTAVTLFDSAGLQILACAADHAHAHAVSFSVMCHDPSTVYSGRCVVATVQSPARVDSKTAEHHDQTKHS